MSVAGLNLAAELWLSRRYPPGVGTGVRGVTYVRKLTCWLSEWQAIVERMSHSFAPNLYKHMQLDSADEPAALGILLAARDAELEGHGVTANDPRRKEIQLCYSILSKPEVRKHYDDAISAGRKITWPEIEHL